MSPRKPPPSDAAGIPDLLHVKGHEAAKRALEVAAAGDHGILLIGPRSSGKTFLAHCLPRILPPPTEEEAGEIQKVYRRAGLEPPAGRPFRVPHHTTRPLDLVGRRRPGEVELAHGGALFLDDLPAFGRRSLRALRKPLEAHEIPGPSGTTAPAVRCLPVAAVRSCPCGNRHDWHQECRCAPWQLARYWRSLEELFLDLVPLHVEVPRVCLSELRSRYGEASGAVAARVREARARQLDREGQDTWNAHLHPWSLPDFCQPDQSGQKLLETAYERLGLTARAIATILRVARTIADLAGSKTVRAPHVAEASQYRSLSAKPGQRRRAAP